jgi:hypothetical protein
MGGSPLWQEVQKDIQVSVKINNQRAILNRSFHQLSINPRLKLKMALKNLFLQMVTISRLSMMFF